MEHTYRPGSLGALMDEYERAAVVLMLLLEDIPDEEFQKVSHPETKDEDYRSIQTIMRHVVYSAYSYADYMRQGFNLPSARPDVPLVSREEAIKQVESVLAYTVEPLEGKWTLPEEKLDEFLATARWGVNYTLEQMFEHAIVHVLRHRRQIERYLQHE
jgi:uncharacterized damage-inducible protein DinB